MYAYTLIRSRRRTLSLEISEKLEVVARAPLFTPRAEIDRFVETHTEWINTHLEKQRRRQQTARPEPTQQEIRALKQRAKTVLAARTDLYAEKMRLYPSGVKITSAKTRFGSCSPKNGICYSWRLLYYPEAAIDYVVVHELAHLKHRNHGKAFYALIESILPDYRERKKLLH